MSKPRFTTDEVRSLRDRVATGSSKAELAKEYGVASATLSRALRDGYRTRDEWERHPPVGTAPVLSREQLTELLRRRADGESIRQIAEELGIDRRRAYAATHEGYRTTDDLAEARARYYSKN
ncbi:MULTISPECIES: hypothetical protein [unclassified Curtobacterium]|uniref:hypothetical protein n=1 Tax=unclassified Curtobacterium TaxID=257496 RepID=UPI003820B114